MSWAYTKENEHLGILPQINQLSLFWTFPLVSWREKKKKNFQGDFSNTKHSRNASYGTNDSLYQQKKAPSLNSTDRQWCPAETSGWQRALSGVMIRNPKRIDCTSSQEKQDSNFSLDLLLPCVFFFLPGKSQRELTRCMGGKLGLQPVIPLGGHRRQEPLGKGLQAKPHPGHTSHLKRHAGLDYPSQVWRTRKAISHNIGSFFMNRVPRDRVLLCQIYQHCTERGTQTVQTKMFCPGSGPSRLLLWCVRIAQPPMSRFSSPQFSFCPVPATKTIAPFPWGPPEAELANWEWVIASINALVAL